MTNSSSSTLQVERCLLLHWPTWDWRQIKPLLELGELPTLDALVQRGSMGELNSVAPAIPALQTASLVTGKRADQHGFLSAHFLDEISGEVATVGSRQRKAAALWNICSRANIPSLWVHWPNAHPCEPILGVNISPMFATTVAPVDSPWPIPEQSITFHPPSSNLSAESLRDLCIHFGELTSQELAPLLPQVSDWENFDDPKLAPLADVVAMTASIHAITTELLQHENWKVAGIHYPGLEQLGLLFPDPNAWNPIDRQSKNNCWYQGILRTFCRWQDLMLSRLLQLVGEQTIIVIVSERGFVMQNNPPAFGAQGSILIAGPNIRRDELIHGAHTLDVVPTILAALGLPVGNDMPGSVLQQAFEMEPIVKTIDSWENVHDPNVPNQTPETSSISNENDEATAQALRELIAMGYQEFIPEETAVAHRLELEQQSNLFQVQMDAGNYAAAEHTLEKLSQAIPQNPWLSLARAQCLMNIGQSTQARTILESLLEQPTPSSVSHMLLGLLASEENNTVEALEHLREASKEHQHWPELHRRIGWLLVRLGKHDEARSAFLKSIQLQPNLASSHLGLANVYMHEARYEEAIDYALTALQSQYFWPSAHALLGIILAKSKRYEDAERAFLVSNAQQSNHLAHTWLATLYGDILKNDEKKQYHQQQADALLKRRQISRDRNAGSNA